jgi:hypothetical protein
MLTRFVEVTDGIAYGKFLVSRLDAHELATPSAMPEAPEGQRLMSYSGRRRFNDHSTLVVDLQRGTAFAWPLQGGRIGMEHFLRSHLEGMAELVCPLYLPFVRWLHEDGTWSMGAGNLDDIPSYIELAE